jgi:WD40 repeat protein
MRVADGAALDAIPDTFQRNRRSLAFAPDGASIAVGYQYYAPAPSTAPAVVARVLRLRDGVAVAELQGTQSVNALRFSPDGSSLAFGAEYGAAELWRVRAGSAWLPAPQRRVWTTDTTTSRALAFSPDGAAMTVVGDERVAVLDTAEQGAPRVTLETTGSPSGALGWGGGGSVAFSPAGDQLAVGAFDVVRVWELRRQSLVRRVEGTRGVAAFSPDGSTLATGGPTNTLRLWNRSTWASRDMPTIADVHALTYVAGGSLVAAGSSRGIALHRATDGVEARRIAVTRQAVPMFDLVASPDGALLAGATYGGWGGGLDVWRIADGQRVFTLEGNLRTRSNFAFTPDTTEVLVALNPSSALAAYALASGRPTPPPMAAPALASVALAPGGSLVALGGANGAVTLRRWPDGALVQTLDEAGPRPYLGARVLRFSPDARTLVRAGGGDTLEVWCRR